MLFSKKEKKKLNPLPLSEVQMLLGHKLWSEENNLVLLQNKQETEGI